MESVFARDTFNAYWIICHVESVFSWDTFNIKPIFWNCRRCLLKRHLYLKFNSFMILKIVEGVSSKGTFHVAKIAVNLSIFWQLPFFNNNFLKLLHKLKKPGKLVIVIFWRYLGNNNQGCQFKIGSTQIQNSV